MKENNHIDIINEYMNQIRNSLENLNMFSKSINDLNFLKIPKIGETPVENSIYLGVLLKNIEHIIDIYKNGIDKLSYLEKLITFTIEKIFESNGLTEINESEDIKIIYAKCPTKLIVFDEEKLKYYFIEKKEIVLDKKSIMKDLKDGKKIDGAELVQEKKVRVKFKPVIVRR